MPINSMPSTNSDKRTSQSRLNEAPNAAVMPGGRPVFSPSQSLSTESRDSVTNSQDPSNSSSTRAKCSEDFEGLPQSARDDDEELISNPTTDSSESHVNELSFTWWSPRTWLAFGKWCRHWHPGLGDQRDEDVEYAKLAALVYRGGRK
ncbi:hypothetical protein P280DRAFT_519407 [Massarina eburnea CBS 473.64]|uniref:Uncharacterized protein n=1 Tax=Massarina eburnea CBS 473.64 TaxID=1395130 RepID=A0A6A6RZ36_9PLEO|nr:hypothetical protein P280DRAFT_519407 [Massarina eburnea CBS 473.64]